MDEVNKLPIDRFKTAEEFIDNSLGIMENIDEDGSHNQRCVV